MPLSTVTILCIWLRGFLWSQNSSPYSANPDFSYLIGWSNVLLSDWVIFFEYKTHRHLLAAFYHSWHFLSDWLAEYTNIWLGGFLWSLFLPHWLDECTTAWLAVFFELKPHQKLHQIVNSKTRHPAIVLLKSPKPLRNSLGVLLPC